MRVNYSRPIYFAVPLLAIRSSPVIRPLCLACIPCEVEWAGRKTESQQSTYAFRLAPTITSDMPPTRAIPPRIGGKGIRSFVSAVA